MTLISTLLIKIIRRLIWLIIAIIHLVRLLNNRLLNYWISKLRINVSHLWNHKLHVWPLSFFNRSVIRNNNGLVLILFCFYRNKLGISHVIDLLVRILLSLRIVIFHLLVLIWTLLLSSEYILVCGWSL